MSICPTPPVAPATSIKSPGACARRDVGWLVEHTLIYDQPNNQTVTHHHPCTDLALRSRWPWRLQVLPRVRPEGSAMRHPVRWHLKQWM